MATPHAAVFAVVMFVGTILRDRGEAVPLYGRRKAAVTCPGVHPSQVPVFIGKVGTWLFRRNVAGTRSDSSLVIH